MRVSRRNFLATAGAAGVAPLFLGATSKSGNRAPILSSELHELGTFSNRRPLACKQIVELVVSFSGQTAQILALCFCKCQF